MKNEECRMKNMSYLLHFKRQIFFIYNSIHFYLVNILFFCFNRSHEQSNEFATVFCHTVKFMLCHVTSIFEKIEPVHCLIGFLKGY